MEGLSNVAAEFFAVVNAEYESLFSSGLCEPGQRSCCEGGQIRTASFPLARHLIMTVRWGSPAYSQESLVVCTVCFFFSWFDNVPPRLLIIALMVFTRLSESRGFISPQQLNHAPLSALSAASGRKRLKYSARASDSGARNEKFPSVVKLTCFTDVAKLPGEDESVPNTHPLCLAVSDGGELQRGGCSVSVQHRCLYTIFRSAHPHTGKYPHGSLGCQLSVPPALSLFVLINGLSV